MNVDTSWTRSSFESADNSSVLPELGGPTTNSQTGSPGSRLPTTAPTTTSTGDGSGR